MGFILQAISSRGRIDLWHGLSLAENTYTLDRSPLYCVGKYCTH